MRALVLCRSTISRRCVRPRTHHASETDHRLSASPVAVEEKRHRYMPESGNWHGWTLTSWNAALSAAPAPAGRQTKFHGVIASPIPLRPAAPGRTISPSARYHY
jgi:hypothetical protein